MARQLHEGCRSRQDVVFDVLFHETQVAKRRELRNGEIALAYQSQGEPAGMRFVIPAEIIEQQRYAFLCQVAPAVYKVTAIRPDKAVPPSRIPRSLHVENRPDADAARYIQAKFGFSEGLFLAAVKQDPTHLAI